MREPFGPEWSAQGYPLTEAQTGIWLGQQLNPDSPLYNAADAIEITADLDTAAFEHALRIAVSEATALNMVFRQTADGPRQYRRDAGWTLIRKDYSACETPFERAMRWMCAELATPVDLGRGPLFCQALIKIGNTGERGFLWYQRIHHIACDGFAFALLSQRVADIYHHLLAGNDATVIGKPFGDYQSVLDEDCEYQQSEKRVQDQMFWRSQLAGMSNPVSLSNSYAPMDTEAIRRSVTLDVEQVSALQMFGTAFGANWSECLLAAVIYLVFRNTAASDITLGVPVMGRMGSASLRVPAMVMNIIPLRIAMQDCKDFKTLLQRVAEQLRKTRRHQRYRYEQLRRDLNVIGGERRLYGPVVNIMPFDRHLTFASKTAPVRNLSAGPVEDVSFAFVLLDNGSLRFDLEANPNRYNADELSRYQSELLDLLSTMVTKPDAPLSVNREKFSWLDGGPFKQTPQLPVVLLGQQVHRNPQAIALIDGDRQLSYGQLFAEARQLARLLSMHGVQRGDVLALALPRGEQAVVANIAALLLRAAYLFIDPNGPQARNSLILQDAQPALLIVKDELFPSSGYQGRQVSLAQLQNENPATPGTFDIADDDQDDPAYLIYTSGSTGRPKGVTVGRHALAGFIAGARQVYNIAAADRVLQFAPLHFDASVEEIFLTLCNGAALVIRDDAMLESVPAFLQSCAKLEITVLDLPTAYWHELVFFCASSGTPVPDCIHTIIIGGEAALAERVDQWHRMVANRIRLLNTYGPSEATVVATCAELRPDVALSIGTPLPGRQIAIVDHELRIVRRGEDGELLLLGAGLGQGYLRSPELTGERFIDFGFIDCNRALDVNGAAKLRRAYRSGDHARINDDGNIEFIGRLDDELKISGHRISPLEVESALLCIEHIREAAVVMQTAAGGEKHLLAFVVSDTPVDIQSLRGRLSASLPAAMLPAAVQVLAALPKNQAGKIDRCLLQQRQMPVESVQTPVSEEEQQVMRIWRQVLGQPSITPQDDFFLLGGQSLQTIQVANRLTAELQRDIPVTLLFQHPTVAELAAVLANNGIQSARDIRAEVLADCVLPEDSIPYKKNSYKPENRKRRCDTLLLTGATGFVGAQLLHRLLSESDATIVCTVRAATERQARQRIDQALAKQDLPFADVAGRVEVLLADIEQPQLGLSDTVFDGLAQRIDAIFHNAAITSVMRDYQSLRAANVIATRELLRVSVPRAIPFHFISTIAIAPSLLGEDFVGWHAGLHDGYQQSKWASECLLRIAAQRGYPISVYRLARVTGDAQSAFINDKDLVWNIIRASVHNGAYPRIDIREPWTPVDVVAQAVAVIALKSTGQGVFNLVSDEVVQLPDLFEWLLEYGFSMRALPLAQWCALLERNADAEDRALLGFFQQRRTATKLEAPEIDNTRCKTLLKQEGLLFPCIGREQFYRYVRYATDSGLLPAPQAAVQGVHNEPA